MEESQGTGSLYVTGHGEVENKVIDEAENPATNAAVGLIPIGIGGAGRNGVVDV